MGNPLADLTPLCKEVKVARKQIAKRETELDALRDRVASTTIKLNDLKEAIKDMRKKSATFQKPHALDPRWKKMIATIEAKAVLEDTQKVDKAEVKRRASELKQQKEVERELARQLKAEAANIKRKLVGAWNDYLHDCVSDDVFYRAS